MQPQAPSPNPNLDFIMQNGQPASKGPKLPGIGLPKLAIRLIAGVFIIAVLVVVYSVITGGSGSKGQSYLDTLARGQEIIRVTTNVGQLATDTPTQNLAATAEASLTSEQAQLKTYLKGQKVPVTDLALNADKDTTTDSEMQTAFTNGDLNSVFASYLKTQLEKYAIDLQTTYKTAGHNGKAILNDAYISTQVMLQSPQLASAN